MRYAASRIVSDPSAVIRIVIFSSALLLTVALSLACSNAPKETPPANSVIVSKDGAGQYTTIGAALKAVQPGMRILVRAGIYDEALIITKQVEIVADIRGPGEQVVLQTLNLSNITMRTDRALVRGFVIRHRPGLLGTLYQIFSGKDGSAVDIPQGELVLEDCDITSNSGVGIEIHGSEANPIIRRTRIHDGRSNGVWVYDGGQGTLEDCDILRTRMAGVRIEDEGNPTLRRCKVHESRNAGVVVTDGGLGTFEDCEIWSNTYHGLESRSGSKPVVRRTSIHHCKGDGIYIHRNSSGTVEDCQVFNNDSVGIGIDEHSTPLIVRSNIFNSAYSDVEISEGSNPIFRECKIYAGQMSGIFIYQNAQGTIENCDIYGHINNQEVVIQDGSDPTLNTCKIHNGKAGGVLVLKEGRGTFENCEIYDNAFSGCGSGPAAVLRSATRRSTGTMESLFYRNRTRREASWTAT